MGRELRANPPQGRPALAKNYTGVRSTCFEQMDVDPPDDRQEPMAMDSSRNARVEDDNKSVNNLWRMCIKSLFTSLDEAKCFSCIQPTKRREILMNLL